MCKNVLISKTKSKVNEIEGIYSYRKALHKIGIFLLGNKSKVKLTKTISKCHNIIFLLIFWKKKVHSNSDILKTENEQRAEIGDALNHGLLCKSYGILGFPKFVD